MALIGSGDMHHSIVKSFDEASESLKTTIVNASVDITVSAFTDSIALADTSGNKVTTTAVSGKRGLDVNVVDLTIDAANDSIAIKNGANQLAINADGSINTVSSGTSGGLTNTELRLTPVPMSLTSTTITNTVAVTGPLTDAQLRLTALPVSLASTTVTNTVAISALTLPLPTNAATSALQTTGNSSVASIDSKVPALGQALATASVPVVLTAAQVATLTPLASVAVTYSNFQANYITLVAGTDTTITFTGTVKFVRVTNWDITNPILVKNSAITTDTDSTAARVGVAPVLNVANNESFPITTTSIHIRSAGASTVTVEGFT